MAYGGFQQNPQQDQYGQQQGQPDQTNKGYRARLVQWSIEVDDLSMMVERDSLLGQFDREKIYMLIVSEMGLWRVIRPQLLRENNKELLGSRQKEFDYFVKYDNDIGLFLEPTYVKDSNGKEVVDYKNMDDLNRLHNIILYALMRLDVLNSSTGSY